MLFLILLNVIQFGFSLNKIEPITLQRK